MLKIPDPKIPRLTEQQKEAAECDVGPVILISGVGSGKTWVIANRFRHLNHIHKIPLDKILCISCTKFTAQNIREKIKHYVFFDEKKWNIMTFHDLCKKILNEIYKDKNIEPKIFVHTSKLIKIVRQILDEYRSINLNHQMALILEGLRYFCKSQNRKFNEEDLKNIISQKTSAINHKKILSQFTFKNISEIYEKFNQELNKRNWGILDEIVLDVIPYLNDAIFKEKLENMFEAILCDEFQDLNAQQFQILTALCKNNNLFCAGDPDQSIYESMGALPEIFIKLKKHFSDLGVKVQIKRLDKNFRSTPQILEVAGKLIGSQDDISKELSASKNGGPDPDINILNSRDKQAKAVIQKIQELKNSNPELDYSEIIVLARNRSHYKQIKDECFDLNIPYEDWSEISPIFKTPEVQDLISWVSLGFYIENDPKKWEESIKKVYNKPKIGLEESDFNKLLQHAKKSTNLIEQIKKETNLNNSKVSKLYFKIKKIQNIIEDEDLTTYEKFRQTAIESKIYEYYINSGDPNKSSNIKNFLNFIKIHKSTSLDKTLDYLYNQNDNSIKKLVFSTIRGIKGLEFKHVLLVSVSNDNFPYKYGIHLQKKEEQENKYPQEDKRLMYVAFTRAMETLHLFSDSGKENQSSFIDDIHHHLKKEIIDDGQEKIEDEEEVDFLEDVLYSSEKLNFISEEDKS